MQTRFQIIKALFTGFRIRGMALVLGAMILASCGGEKSDPLAAIPESIPASSKQLEKVFSQAPPRVKSQSQKLIEAYQRGDFEEAAGMVVQMQNNPELDFDQQWAIRNSRSALEKNLARGVEAGDPKAIAAFRRLQGSAASQ
jgi:hypothetical protein